MLRFSEIDAGGEVQSEIVLATRSMAPQTAVAVVRAALKEIALTSHRIEALMPDDLPTAPAVLQARRNAAARHALIEEFGLLSSAEIAEIAGSRAKNRAALASRWHREGRLFAVEHRGETRFPAFQLDADGKPLDGVGEIVESLGGEEGWPTALWFLAINGHLGDRRPVDVLASEPEAVHAAACAEADEVF
ncbi:MAG: hypothetical protein AAGC60_29170 [Acidobacteriota bacterium]